MQTVAHSSTQKLKTFQEKYKSYFTNEMNDSSTAKWNTHGKGFIILSNKNLGIKAYVPLFKNKESNVWREKRTCIN